MKYTASCCLFFVAAVSVWTTANAASVPLFLTRGSTYEIVDDNENANRENSVRVPEVIRVMERVPPPLCIGRCTSPPAGPVCAFDATGTARTFATLCELEAVSCRESIYYAITSLGEC